MKIKLGLPGVMLVIILIALVVGEVAPESILRLCFTTSLLIKSCLLFILPLIIFLLLFSGMFNIVKQKGGIKVILLLIPIICISNFFTTWIAYVSGSLFISGKFAVLHHEHVDGLTPFMDFKFPVLIENQIALFSGMFIGIACSLFLAKQTQTLAQKANTFVIFILRKIIVPIMPIFIFGFLVKFQHDKVMGVMIKEYGYLFLVMVCVQIAYVVFLFGLGKNFNLRKWHKAIKNASPGIATGFSTMSSASSLPLIFDGAEKNTSSKGLSRLVVSTTVNIHLIGDCVAIPITAFALLQNFGMPFPDISTFLTFSLFFVLAKFAVAAVPAGGILVMLPILEQHLGFSNSMLSMITAIYIVFDPIITAVNVAGNSAFAIVFDKFNNKLFGIGN
ncbi:MAG: dicarboxylate/amino acid:cation symporter [Francisellaceae bacterium]|nr:dicarboxylate/amino acid:cation symporter [Francisellaceae bacterium]MBT6537917.1 dicarboxylate/amino acid:cation symporter [Francisellaceae bacterium]